MTTSQKEETPKKKEENEENIDNSYNDEANDEILRLINTPVFNVNLCFDSRVSRITHIGVHGTPSANTTLSTNDIISLLQLGITTLQNQKEATLKQQLLQQHNQIQELEKEKISEEETE